MHGSKGKIFIPIEEVRLGYANQICDLLAQLLRKLPEPPPEIYGFCAFAVLQGALAWLWQSTNLRVRVSGQMNMLGIITVCRMV